MTLGQPTTTVLFLDRGELEQLIEAEDAHLGRTGDAHPYQPGHRSQADNDDEHGRSGQPGRGRRRGFLGDLFDLKPTPSTNHPASGMAAPRP